MPDDTDSPQGKWTRRDRKKLSRKKMGFDGGSVKLLERIIGKKADIARRGDEDDNTGK